DVIVDLRPNSPTFREWRAFELTEENNLELYIPEYFGHGYLVLEDSVVSYKCAEVFFGEGDSGIMYNDSDINITWPFDKIGGVENLIISGKDENLMSFEEFTKKLK
ncbi:dTDP-4-dehydrorhamnose 3,5-epimerase family protein, partial [Oceanihabitans sediminis]|uniref:dTDP-4-dehydrorhamnose 3,5-epimerase family protein n=1 Tax=Oceanihabitans sediminis TaxID=1812012 RepID=UPI003A91ED0F